MAIVVTVVVLAAATTGAFEIPATGLGLPDMLQVHGNHGVGFIDLTLPRAPGEPEYVGLGSPVAALAAGPAHVYVLTTDGNLEVVEIPRRYRAARPPAYVR